MPGRYTVRRFVLGAMALVALTALAGVAMAMRAASEMRSDLAAQVTSLQHDEQVVERIVRQAERQVGIVTDFAGRPDPALAATFREEGFRLYDELRAYLFRDLTREERILVERIRELHERIEVAVQPVFAGEDAAVLLAELAELPELRAQLAQLLRLRRESSLSLLEAQGTLLGRLYLVLGGLAVLFLAVVGAATLFLRRRLVEPLVAISEAAQRIGEGEFEARVGHAGNDELGDVARSFNHMAERLERARHETARAEGRFRELVEGVSAVVWEADSQTFTCSYVSPQAETLFGYPVSAWATPDIWQRIIHPDEYDAVMAECRLAVREQRDHELQYRCVRSDGSIVWVRDSVRIVRDAAGGPSRLLGVITDISAARGVEQALRESEERYHSLVDRVPIGLYRTTPDGRFVDVNAAMAGLFGFHNREALLQANATDMYVETQQRKAWQVMLDAAPGAVEVDRQHRRHDGSVIWLRDTGRAVRDADGGILYYEGALQDVTERVEAGEALRRSEARFRSLIENASEGLLVLSARMEVLYQSPAVERILGYSPDELAALDLLSQVHPDDQQRMREAFRQVVSGRARPQGSEMRCRHRDGRWVVVHATSSNQLHDPAVAGIVVHMVDTTAQRQLEAQFAQAQKLEAVGRLAGGIAHDFNNLLTAIEGYTFLLADRTSGDSEAQEELAEIRRAVERGARLTRQLLAFGRREVVQRRDTDVSAVSRDIEQMLRRLITEDVALDADIAPGCWANVDAGQLEQVVLNLVVNARDAAPRSGIRLSVSREQVAGSAAATGLPAGEYVVLVVSDDGCGIDPEDMPFIFDPFFTTKELGKGTGLGLPTVYSIVEQSGGRVVVHSEPGRGTAVHVYLPSVSPADAPVAPETVASIPERGEELILLVEDEPAVRALAERVLQRQGYNVVAAHDGQHALELAAAMPGVVDLLVTDVVMPRLGGVELAERLGTLQPGLRVLFMSGYAPDDLPRPVGGGPLHFLEKPFAPADLQGAVRQVLDELEPAGR